MEAGRPALWTPVAFGIGVAVYFGAAREPELWAAVALCAASLLGVFAARRGFLSLGLALGLAAASAGFLSGKVATLRAEAPALVRPMTAEVEGRVAAIEPRAGGSRRVTIDVDRFGTLPEADRPARARLTLEATPPLRAGDRLRATAFWRPPDGPVRPGGYDFARMAFFDGVGATASRPRSVTTLGPAADAGLAARASAALQRLRMSLTARVTEAVGGPEGTVAAALVTGVQGPIPQAVEDDLRAAGLSHILSISGLHMALLGGTIFWIVRAALALSARAALDWPVKQIAAATALLGATFYLALSGAEVATQRSWIMIAIMFGAVIAGRSAFAPRNLALAALLVLAWTPEALLGPSFQMSFAAVAALLAWFEARRGRDRTPPPPSRLGRAARWLAAAAAIALMTTLIAGLATAPFSAYHFNRLTPFALAGNALATPLISLLVMPAVVGGLAFAPLGLDGPWWSLMGLGLSGVLTVARWVASWPGAERYVPAFGEVALVLFALGVAWGALWRTALRLGAAPILAVALLLSAWPARPDVSVDPLGRSLAARGPDGRLAVLGGSASGFAAKVWLAADGVGPPYGARPHDARCDALGCVAPLLGGGLVALVQDPRAFDEDCRRAALVVTHLDAPADCRRLTAVVDGPTLAATGALSLFRDGAAFRARAARDPAGDRPWQRRPSWGRPAEGRSPLVFAPPEPARADPGPAPVDPTDPDVSGPADDDQ